MSTKLVIMTESVKAAMNGTAGRSTLLDWLIKTEATEGVPNVVVQSARVHHVRHPSCISGRVIILCHFLIIATSDFVHVNHLYYCPTTLSIENTVEYMANFSPVPLLQSYGLSLPLPSD